MSEYIQDIKSTMSVVLSGLLISVEGFFNHTLLKGKTQYFITLMTQREKLERVFSYGLARANFFLYKISYRVVVFP